MKKGLIVTLYGNYNYGNKLQNYATQEYLESNDIKVKTLIFGPVHRNLYRSIRHGLKVILKDYILKSFKQKQIDKQRKINFLNFDKNINKISINEFNKKSCDYIFIGSDQVWNSNDLLSRQIVSYVNENDGYYISISASVGNNRILPEFEKDYSNHFKKVNFISVREDNAKDIIENLTGRNDVQVILDPTMLIPVEKWNNKIKKPKQIEKLCPNNEKYILNYFLGKINNVKMNEINEFAKKHNCKIINILDKNDPFYICAPDEFLWLEKNSFAIFTDSFHSTVFAILFNKPFLVFERDDNNESMNSRLQTLLNKFGFKEKFYKGKIDDSVFNIDYSNVDEVLIKERKKALKFLKGALNDRGGKK